MKRPKPKIEELVGTEWLLQHFGLKPAFYSCRSRLGSRRSSHIEGDIIEETYTARYRPGPRPLEHVEFSLKHEHLSLDLLLQVFGRIPAHEVDDYVRERPTSKFRRKIGFLFEFLTPDKLQTEISGNYVPLLDPEKYLTGNPHRNSRWRVLDNLLGNGGFCPMVRRTPPIEEKLGQDWAKKARDLTRNTDARLWARAVSYLYRKETKASFAIEHEEITPAREERFVAALANSSTLDSQSLLAEDRLTELQNLIVDPRYAEKGFREEQNYVGQSLPNYRKKVHYVCPPSLLLPTLMAGLRTFRNRSAAVPPAVRAAIVSFGFVYMHPFCDGNGRIHRLLLHESLSIDGYTDPGVVLPLSAPMLRDSSAYDRVLETVSKVVHERVRYRLENDGHLVLEEWRAAEGAWRYPDFTPHVEYVLDVIEAVVTQDLPEELDFLQKADDAVAAIQQIVDLPDRKMNLLLSLLMQNQGRLSSNKRTGLFAELTDAEIVRIEGAFADHFGPPAAV